MRRFLFTLILISGTLMACTDTPSSSSQSAQVKPVAAPTHSAAFTASMDRLVTDYLSFSENLVQWDSAQLPARLNALQRATDSLSLQELATDSALHAQAATRLLALRSDLDALHKAGNLTATRTAFDSFSRNLYDLLGTVQYSGATVYLQECPMAFNDTIPAVWLSKTANIRNPYLGLHHPRYKSGMLVCGEVKDSLHFVRN